MMTDLYDPQLWADTTTDAQLDRVAKAARVPHWRGVHARDTMPQPPRKRESMIINIQGDADGQGTHWVGLWRDGDRAFYFDSYGAHPVAEARERYPASVSLVSQTWELQPITQPEVKYCGPIALHVMKRTWDTEGDFVATVLDLKHKYSDATRRSRG